VRPLPDERPLNHECGHAIALLHVGVPVLRIRASPDGFGKVDPAREVSNIEDRLISFAAGFAAALELGESHLAVSRPDFEAMDRIGESWAAGQGIPWTDGAASAVRELFLTRAKHFVRDHEMEITFLARRLGDAGGLLTSADIGRLCREPGSPLSRFSGLYANTAFPTLAPRGDGVWRRVSCRAF
jgi:hypothetical protein